VRHGTAYHDRFKQLQVQQQQQQQQDGQRQLAGCTIRSALGTLTARHCTGSTRRSIAVAAATSRRQGKGRLQPGGTVNLQLAQARSTSRRLQPRGEVQQQQQLQLQYHPHHHWSYACCSSHLLHVKRMPQSTTPPADLQQYL
jgi:hypothetical protein